MLEVKGLCVQLGTFSLSDITFDVHDGEYFVLLGPTGSGKTMLLESLAGLKPVSSGQVWINGRDVTSFNLEKRKIGFAHQDYAVYGHLSVRDNISFGLMYRYKTRRETEQAVDRAVELLGIEHLLRKRPTFLSGGETQKIALARAISIKPDLLLLDEPLSAVDAATRDTYERELRELHNRLKLRRILQIGTPQQVFRHPTSEFVARFFMTRNIFQGEVQDALGEQSVFCLEGQKLAVVTALRGQRHASIRPENISISKEGLNCSDVNSLLGTIYRITDRGSIAYITVDVPPEFTCLVLQPTLEEMGLEEKQKVFITFKASAVNVF
jgi:ABC-type sugar transport system ATPase subunit